MASPGWSGLFWNAFKRSRNPMVMLDERRRCVEVNGALLSVLGHRRDALVGRPANEMVEGPPVAESEWQALLARREFTGDGVLQCADGSTLSVQWAGHVETITGRQLVLLVALTTARRGRFARLPESGAKLSEREREVLQHVAMGRSGPEIADELQIAHDTVRTHVRNAQGKLGARSRAHLVAIALGDGHTAAAN